MNKVIFTLIEYTEGGNKAPCSCCTEWEYGQISVSSFDQTEYENIAHRMASIIHSELTKSYHYETWTLLINGIASGSSTGNADKEADHDNHWFDGDLTEEGKAYNTYVDAFWAYVESLNEKAKADHEAEQARKIAAEKKRKEDNDLLAKQQREDKDKAEYARLAKLYGPKV